MSHQTNVVQVRTGTGCGTIALGVCAGLVLFVMLPWLFCGSCAAVLGIGAGSAASKSAEREAARQRPEQPQRDIGITVAEAEAWWKQRRDAAQGKYAQLVALSRFDEAVDAQRQMQAVQAEYERWQKLSGPNGLRYVKSRIDQEADALPEPGGSSAPP